MNFKKYLINEHKHLENNSAGCEHCNTNLKITNIIIGDHMYPIGQLLECNCKKSKIFTNTIRNVERLLQYINKETAYYSNGFCNDKKCGYCFDYIMPLKNGIDVPSEMQISIHNERADRCGCMKCKDNQNILLVGKGFLPEKSDTTKHFIDFYTKHKDRVEKLYKDLSVN